MKKIASIGLLVLVASMIVGSIPSVEALSDPTVLLRLAKTAQNQVDRQISHSDNVSDEIRRLFNEGVSEVNAIQQAARTDDMESVKQHFLNAMKIFKKITMTLNQTDIQTRSADVTESVTAPQRDHNNDFDRLKQLISTLKSIARSQSVNFAEVDGLVDKATKQVKENDREGLKATIDQLKSLLGDIQDELRKHASQKTGDREIKFFSSMIDRLEQKDVNQDLLAEVKQMLAEFKQLLADENYHDAKELKRTLTDKIKELYKSLS
jgi:flagellin-specific chaperone FliS